MKSATIFTCEICNTGYDTESQALECEAKGREKVNVEVGDVVLGGAGFGWFDGDPKWIANPQVGTCVPGGVSTYAKNPKHGNCFGACCTYQFYYVVTKIDGDPRDGHRARVHVATKAMCGAQGYRGGWTGRDHIHMKLAKNVPPEVLADTADLIGLESDGIL